MEKITIIDDELNICKSVDYAVKQSGYRCNYYTNSVKALEVLKEELPDLIILDIIMPAMDGLELLRQIRKISEKVPVIFLSSKDEAFDKVLGLEMGADDYLCKPFSMKELIARIKVCLRRSRLIQSSPLSDENTVVKAGPLEIHPEHYTMTWNGTQLILTTTEFRILSALAINAEKVKTREQLLDSAFPSDYYVSDRTIDTHIKRIRKKIKLIDKSAEPVKTVFGVGYKFLVL